ncbi:hypothetical protein BaRGS_00031005 [Batillaria attramentaria]|uniref:Uncharacterized protein n=1 Tax=Batillaria attramentaria TaxID=370345 RepID=A0ABD0JS77_9CAEN
MYAATRLLKPILSPLERGGRTYVIHASLTPDDDLCFACMWTHAFSNYTCSPEFNPQDRVASRKEMVEKQQMFQLPPLVRFQCVDRGGAPCAERPSQADS